MVHQFAGQKRRKNIAQGIYIMAEAIVLFGAIMTPTSILIVGHLLRRLELRQTNYFNMSRRKDRRFYDLAELE